MELESIMEESINILEESFYNKKFYYSYSSLNKLLWNPTIFYHLYVLGLKQEKVEQHLIQGKLIHLLLLEPEKFKEKFLMIPENLPKDNVKIVIDRVFSHYSELSRNGDTRTELEEFQGALLDVMRDINYHQSLKTDAQRIDKIITDDTKSYWKFLKLKVDKTLVDEPTYKYCYDAVEIVKTNSKICKLIGCNISDFDNVKVINELEASIDFSSKSYGLKGIIDNIVINHDEKIIYINDIKTTSKELKDFSESIEYYSYWLQAIMYMIMADFLFRDLIDQGYNVKFHFVVIDKAFQTYAFPVSENTLNSWLDRFNEVIEKAEWHYKNKNYELPYDFANDLVIL
jgi:hypothetical protein